MRSHIALLVALAGLLGAGFVNVTKAEAAACAPFTQRAWFDDLRIYKIRTTRVSCTEARRQIRRGSPAASTYDWIPGWRCGPRDSAGSGYNCRNSGRSIRFYWRLK